MRKLWLFSIVALIAVAFASCSEDDDYAAAYCMDFVEAACNADGFVTQIYLDDGQSYMAKGYYRVDSKNEIIRALCVYVVEKEGIARLVQVSKILTAPVVNRTREEAKRDPLYVESVWVGGKYLNFRLRLPTGPAGKQHVLGVALVGIDEKDGEGRTAELYLLHEQGGDDAYYYRDAYLSCDISTFVSQQNIDSLCLSAVTDFGEKTYGFKMRR